MSMAVGGTVGLKADINMTPLIDVLLVLLIIFMVITPLDAEGAGSAGAAASAAGRAAERSGPAHGGDHHQQGQDRC